MGFPPFSSIHSDIYMHYLKLNLFHNLNISIYTHYVDDCFALLNASEPNLFNILSVMNSLHELVAFNYEKENNNQLFFLDILTVCENNFFYSTVYCKPFTISLLPHLSSHSPNKKFA